MFPTLVRLSKASRRPLTTKRGNKDFYKGTRQAYLPGGHRTGAPGKHVIGGKAKYRLLDEKVRVYVAPPLEAIQSSSLKPYVSLGVYLSRAEERAVFGKFPGPRGLTPEYFLKVSRERTQEANRSESTEVMSSDTSDTDANSTDNASVTDISTMKPSTEVDKTRS